VWYVQRLYPDVADRGGAYAFSPVAEAFLNFGAPGVVITFLMLGIVLAWLDWSVDQPRLPLWRAVGYALTLPWIVLFARLDFATFIKSFGLLTLGQVVVAYLASELIRSVAVALSARQARGSRQ
jgi:hypothetical protein